MRRSGAKTFTHSTLSVGLPIKKGSLIWINTFWLQVKQVPLSQDVFVNTLYSLVQVQELASENHLASGDYKASATARQKV